MHIFDDSPGRNNERRAKRAVAWFDVTPILKGEETANGFSCFVYLVHTTITVRATDGRRHRRCLCGIRLAASAGERPDMFPFVGDMVTVSVSSDAVVRTVSGL